MEFSSTVTQTPHHVVLAVAGDVDLAAHRLFQADIEQAWDGSSDLVIDCAQVTFLDSMGLRVLVHTLQRAAEYDRRVTLAAPSAPVTRILDLAGITEMFTIVESVPGTEG
ncbi:anti-anti-sigma factor [Catenulispora sp. GP43]|uniref:STAS domain-containing protein n=1 Tax=Catenulispora sp. GP43 TaxID=3156263 RepID=UPI0035151DCC